MMPWIRQHIYHRVGHFISNTRRAIANVQVRESSKQEFKRKLKEAQAAVKSDPDHQVDLQQILFLLVNRQHVKLHVAHVSPHKKKTNVCPGCGPMLFFSSFVASREFDVLFLVRWEGHGGD